MTNLPQEISVIISISSQDADAANKTIQRQLEQKKNQLMIYIKGAVCIQNLKSQYSLMLEISTFHYETSLPLTASDVRVRGNLALIKTKNHVKKPFC